MRVGLIFCWGSYSTLRHPISFHLSHPSEIWVPSLISWWFACWGCGSISLSVFAEGCCLPSGCGISANGCIMRQPPTPSSSVMSQRASWSFDLHGGALPLQSTLLHQSLDFTAASHSFSLHLLHGCQRRLSQVPTCLTVNLLLTGKALPFQVNSTTLLSRPTPKPPQSSHLYMDVTLFWEQPPLPLFATQMAEPAQCPQQEIKLDKWINLLIPALPFDWRWTFS